MAFECIHAMRILIKFDFGQTDRLQAQRKTNTIKTAAKPPIKTK